MHDPEIFEEKRNCGRTGPTSPESRAASSQNAVKHGACACTLILPHESQEEWELEQFYKAHHSKPAPKTEKEEEKEEDPESDPRPRHRLHGRRSHQPHRRPGTKTDPLRFSS
jgi:hypothetical protein